MSGPLGPGQDGAVPPQELGMQQLPGPGMPGTSDAFDPRQMQAMMQMAAMSIGGGVPQVPAPDSSGVDPAMAAAYMQVFQAYFQQQALRGAADPGMGGASLGLPPLPGLPGMPSPYAPTPYSAPMPPIEPSVTVAVEGMKFQYQLTEDDLHKVFSRYGAVKHIRVDEGGSGAAIAFHSFQDAQAAMQDLNGKVLNGLEGTLRINWLTPPAPLPYPQAPFPGWGFMPPGAPPPWPGAGQQPPAGAGGAHGTPPGGESKTAHVKGVRKYTCRFLIGIENDKEFQVARRIIGAKGANMKRIVRETEAKLRLRGMGSGYFEGAGQKESSEPLQLCVSCTSSEGYRGAVQQVEELLKRIYEEYKQYCRDNAKGVPDLQINLSENQLVYSSGRGGGGGAGATMPAGALMGGPDDLGDGSPGKPASRRGRRTRAKRNANGEIDRGEPGPNAPSQQEIEQFIDDRNEARRACNFAEADRIRDMLHTRGVALMDEPGGRGRGAEVTTWRYWRD